MALHQTITRYQKILWERSFGCKNLLDSTTSILLMLTLYQAVYSKYTVRSNVPTLKLLIYLCLELSFQYIFKIRLFLRLWIQNFLDSINVSKSIKTISCQDQGTLIRSTLSILVKTSIWSCRHFDFFAGCFKKFA